MRLKYKNVLQGRRKEVNEMTKTIIGVFTDRSDVEEAISKLKAEDFNPKDISIVMKDKREGDEINDDTGSSVAEGAVSGAATGAVLGGITGLLAGTVMPVIGGLLIGGPIGVALGLTGAAATTVSGMATGLVAGGLLGALMGLGLPEEDAQHYEQRVKEGAILLAVPARPEEVTVVATIFEDNNASDIKTISQPQDERASRRTRSSDTEDYQRRTPMQSYQQFAQMGAKGGATGTRRRRSNTESKSGKSPSGKGWHGDSKHHREARQGKEPHHK